MTRILRPALFLMVASYVLLVGATFNGILTVPIRTLSTGLVVGLVGWWTVVRLRGRRTLPGTPLDPAILLWIAAFVLSFLANLEDWRRSAIGLWYVGLYLWLWYALSEAAVRRWITRATLIDMLLLPGAIALAVGFLQQQVIWANGLAALPVSVFGNTNSFGTFLILLLPLALGRAFSARRVARPVMALYALATAALVFLIGSRGAWLGAAAGAATFVLFGPPAQIVWGALQRLTASRRRWVLAVSGFLLAGALIVAAVFFLSTFNRAGRTLDLRTWIYDTALTVFREQPITGSGLFTFGGELARLNSTPNHEPHSHAHSLVFNVMAELGIVGLVALALTAALLLRALIRPLRAGGWRALGGEAAGLWAAVVGVGVHLLFDTTIMMPALALGLLIVVVGAMNPSPPELLSHASALQASGERERGGRTGPPLQPRTGSVGVDVQPEFASVPSSEGRPSAVRRVATTLIALLALVLAVTAIWSTTLYTRYVETLSTAIATGDLTGGAEALDAIIAADPQLAITHGQRGMLLALAGDAVGAAESFERYTALAPQYGIGWYNLAALRLADGDREGARLALDRALELTPDLAALAFPVLPQADPFALEWEFGANIPHAQFMRMAILRLFVPQVALLGEDVTLRSP
ncbi:MAG: O-antigen ligase family protein [Chloroflexi bacterium]|nr:O-antigen ligase family protein [Chloroflexota bacterium]